MRAITASDGKLTLTDQPVPEPTNKELLIRVEAAALNRTDLAMRDGKSGYKTNPILGIEVAGVVEKADEQRTFAVGDRVMGLVNGGGYAEYAVMPSNRAMRIPTGFSFEEGAAIPEVFLTAYQTLFWHGRLAERESVLIHAGASGVGTAAIQLATQLRQAKVIVTAGSEEKLDVCHSLGADVTVNYKTQAFEDEVLKATNNEGVNVLLDFIGASYWDKNLKSIGTEGRWVLIGVLGGPHVDNVNLFKLMAKYVQLTGTLLTPRSDDYKTRLTADFAATALPLFKSKKIRPMVDTTFSLEDASLAHEHMEANRNIGKIILTLDS
ncbi:NAD(P)H-quinone oxidoreductase [Aureibacillus halotolerans]|uniref:Putative PIG3 family NAD(P)H quinone oxidoreductase n=1 Tax=Aureibacillus halotolerans TaxID=1508390 RepID=A0A4V3D4J8_9BACI|nr:NAD(P)H-quinone oxidoreductase [Aureibacillus halotolerans]TDQ36577.1 putative PIG3 family NAD(P)H quinone oxidoreductase [Aureibacillus halotolerans]